MEEELLASQQDTMPATPKPVGPDTSISSIGEITDVNADTGKYIKQKYSRQLLYGGLILGILEVAWLLYIFYSDNVTGDALMVALVPFFVAFVAFGLIRNKVEDVFMQQFAAANGFNFQKFGLPSNLDGNLFNIGHGQTGRDFITGTFESFPLSLFNYSYTVGSGKSAHTYFYTVFCLDYPEALPPIFLKVNGQQFGEDIFGYFSKNDPEKIQLEGDFNQFFTLYTKKGFETEALEVFTPDFMVKIQDEWKNFSLEFVNNHLYIYCSHTISKKIELDSIYSLARFLIEKVGPLAARMKSDVAAMDGYFDKK